MLGLYMGAFPVSELIEQRILLAEHHDEIGAIGHLERVVS